MWFGKATGVVEELAFAPDSRTLYTVAGNQIDAWDLATHANRVLVPPDRSERVAELRVAPDGRHLRTCAASSYSREVAFLLRDAETGEVVSRTAAPEHFSAGRLAADGRYAWGFDDSTKGWWRWDWKASKLLPPVPWRWPNDLRTANQWNSALHPDGRTLAVGERGEGVVLFDLDTGAAIKRLAGSEERPLAPEKQMAFTPGGDKLFVFSDGDLVAFDWRSARGLWSYTSGGRTGYVRELVFHPSGALVAYIAGVAPKNWPSVAWFTDVTTGEPRSMPHPGFKGASCVAFSPDGLTCAVASTETQFAVFDVDL
ncbi:WD40 repeat domain-containing protein [Gemmata sp. JC717]|uniref:WD40 repeat domain-containing protein n=1 Tax=Gemmata algarum TaxID=2975278 RepID=UPI0021BAAEF3|nr:WD40 repeat domain-containing protein [Gemmata algarum]MDY3554263.1 WD40 repeat domain-containing protein [Gemmata algarum]